MLLLDDQNASISDTHPSNQDHQAAEKVDLRALAEEILKLLKEEFRRENERLGR